MTGHAFQRLVTDGGIRAGVRAALREAGCTIDEHHGDRHGGPLTPHSREIVTVARRR